MTGIMKIRIFMGKNCTDCAELFVLSFKYGCDKSCEYIDVFSKDKDIQNLCDEQNVDMLPHLQIVHNDIVVSEHVGPLDEKSFLKFVGLMVDE